MIYLAADHFGYQLKRVVSDWLNGQRIEFAELGSKSPTDEQAITDFIPQVSKAVLADPANRGIMICGTGIGVDIGANRFRGIRSVLASSPKVAEWSRTFDNSNVLCLSGWDASEQNVIEILIVWFETPFKDPDGSKSKFLSAMDRWT